VGEPPHQVTAAAVRRRVIRRRMVEAVAGAVASGRSAIRIRQPRRPGPTRRPASSPPGTTTTPRRYPRGGGPPGRPASSGTEQVPPPTWTPSLTCSPDPAAWRHGRSQHPPRRTWRPTPERSSRPPTPHINVRRSRKPARPSRSAEYPPGCWPFNARQGAASWWRSRSPSMTAPPSCSPPRTRPGPRPPTAPPSAHSWPASASNDKSSLERGPCSPLAAGEAGAGQRYTHQPPIPSRQPSSAWLSHRGDHDVPETASSR